MATTSGPCANPNCTFGGVAQSNHQCPDCGKNIHAPCGDETDDLHLVLCPPCKTKRQPVIVNEVVHTSHHPAPAPNLQCRAAAGSAPTIHQNNNVMEAHQQAPLSSSSLEDMLHQVDIGVQALRTEWTGSILFPIAPVLASACTELPSFQLPHVVEDDICLYLGGQRSEYVRLYFCPKTFKPPPADSDSSAHIRHFAELKRCLEKAALDCGSQIFCNGGKEYRQFRCNACVNRQNSQRQHARRQRMEENKGQIRNSSLINDRNNKRPNGKNLPRRTTTKVSDRSCSFTFTVRWDSHGYYVSLWKKAGNPVHKYHAATDPLSLPFPTRLLDNDDRKEIGHLAHASVGEGVGRNYIFSKRGRYLSCQKFAYLYSVENEPPTSSDHDDLLKFFERTEDIAYSVLWDCPPDDTTPSTPLPTNAPSASPTRLYSHTKLDGKVKHQVHNQDPSMAELVSEAQQARVKQKIPNDTNLLVAIAWVIKQEVRYFKLYPEVMHADVTSHTNQYKYHLMTLSCKTPLGQQVVFMRLWLPNQRRATFRWVFQHCLPSLIPKAIFGRTRLIMTDGDAQQRAEILLTIKDYIPKAVPAGCGWHIVGNSWDNRTGISDKGFPAWKQPRVSMLFQHIRSWCYSWMSPGYCEDAEEYQVSKSLLFAYLQSNTVKALLHENPEQITRIITFLRERVLVHDDLFLFYKRKALRFLDVAHNSAHEGTNSGLKMHASRIKSSLTLVNSAKNMSTQAKLKAAALVGESYQALSEKKIWSSLPTAPHILLVAESLLNQHWQRSREYLCRRTGPRTFELMHMNKSDHTCDIEMEHNEIKENIQCKQGDLTPIPVFQRKRRVTISQQGKMKCSCFAFERNGLPCVHIHKVNQVVRRDWKGFHHHDIHVRWWSLYSVYAHAGSGKLAQLLEECCENEDQCPILRCNIPNEIQIESPFAVPSKALDRITNYSKQDLEVALSISAKNHADHRKELELGLSQSSFIPSNFGNEFESDTDDTYDGIFPEQVFGNDDDNDHDNGLLNRLSVKLFEDSLDPVADGIAEVGTIREQMQPYYEEMTSVLESIKDADAARCIKTILRTKIQDFRARIIDEHRESSVAGNNGTIGMVVEKHAEKKRKYNTHHPFYQRQKSTRK